MSKSASRAKEVATSGAKAAKPAASAKAAPKSGARKPAKSAKSAKATKPAAKKAKAAAAKPPATRATKAAASRKKTAAKSRTSRTKAGASADSRRWWHWPTDTGRTARKRPKSPATGPRSRPAIAPRDDGSRVPLLQRRSTAALLARAAVLAVAFVGMIAFAVALARATLVPSVASDALVHTNLRPGASIRAYLDQPETRDAVRQIGGNVLLGVPFGVLLPALFPRLRGLLRVALATALVMVMVETAQGVIVEGRAFDIDDVILNTGGALLGYLLFGRSLGRALHPRRPTWWHRLAHGTPPALRVIQGEVHLSSPHSVPLAQGDRPITLSVTVG